MVQYFSTVFQLRTFLFSALVLFSSFSFAATNNSLTVLQYHHVSDNTPPVTSITPQNFLQHMEYLQQNNFKVLPLEAAIEWLEAKQPLPDMAVAITFDDGFLNIYQNAFPILKQFDYPFTVFVNTRPILEKTRSYMNWQQLAELQQYKGSILNHGHDHESMLPLKDENNKQWRDRVSLSITKAQQLLNTHLAVTNKLLAYPYGEFNLELEQLVDELGYKAFGQHSGAMSHFSKPTRLPRFPAAGIYANLNSLKRKLVSLPLEVSYLSGEESWLPEATKASLELEVNNTDYYRHMLQCFYMGQPIKPDNVKERQYLVKHELLRESIRERINCTAPSIKHDARRYYWWSHPYFYRHDVTNTSVQ